MSITPEGLRIRVRVKTGSSRPGVGGRYGDGELVVAVSARPVDGAANAAVLAAIAAAFGVRPRAVSLVLGSSNRSKVLFVAGDPGRFAVRLVDLLEE